MKPLTTNDLLFIAEILLDKVDTDDIKKEYNISDEYIRYLREELLNMVKSLAVSGKFEIIISEDNEDNTQNTNCGCPNEKD